MVPYWQLTRTVTVSTTDTLVVVVVGTEYYTRWMDGRPAQPCAYLIRPSRVGWRKGLPKEPGWEPAWVACLGPFGMEGPVDVWH